MSKSMASIWLPYGLRRSPFFQTELRPDDPDVPVSQLFVGRDSDALRVRRRVASDPSSRTIVQGAPGVGKTSFVNRIKYEASLDGISSYPNPIRISSDSTRITFVADALRTLIRIRTSAERIGGTRSDATFWERTGRLLEGGEIRGGSFTLPMAAGGGGVTRSYIAPQFPEASLYEHLGEALRLLHIELEAPVLLHVNNLENVRDTIDTAALIRDLRDYFLIDGAHWIFVGPRNVEAEIFRAHTQVSGIFPAAETLEPLVPDEIASLLARRYEHLKVPKQRLTPPIEPEVAARIYRLYQGDLRNFLRLLGDAAERILGLHGVQPMTEEGVLRAMAPAYAAELRDTIGENDAEHLARIVAAFHGGEFRVTDAVDALNMPGGSVSPLVERLLNHRVIRRTRTEGRSVYYRPIGAVLIAMGILPEA
jgi:hypothetical protein